MKQCTQCKEYKNESEFHKKKESKDGVRSICKKCRKINSHINYLNNKEKILSINRKYNIKNKDIISKKNREKRIANLELFRKNSRIYYKNHKNEVLFKHKKYKDENKDSLKIHNIIYNKSYAKYPTYFEKLSKYEECRQDPNNLELLQVRCKQCNEWFNPTNIQVRHRYKSILTTMGNSYFFCTKNCKDKFNLKLTDRELIEYKKYKIKVQNDLNRRAYPKGKWRINPDDLPRGRNKYHIDHIFSVLDEFKNKVPIEVINNIFNLMMLPEVENLSKLDDSYITIGELYEDYELWNKLYNS
jgi:hypothetical protein